MTRQEALAAIADLIASVENLIQQAQKIADETGVHFYWEGPTYGMGGTYTPPREKTTSEDDWESSDESDEGWRASSNQW